MNRCLFRQGLTSGTHLDLFPGSIRSGRLGGTEAPFVPQLSSVRP